MKNKKEKLILIIINLLFAIIINTINDFRLVLFLDFCISFLLSIIYNYYIKKKLKPKSPFVKKFSFIYLLNITTLNILFLVFKSNYLLVKIINTFITIKVLNTKQKEKKLKIENLSLYLILFNLTLIFCLTSSMVPIGNRNASVDCGVFRYIATIMTKGKVPYKDIFDHKGILLYFINYIAILIHKEVGIWIIELIFFYLTSITIYKTARLFVNKYISFTVALLAIINYIYMYNATGNFTEEYAMLFISISLYLFYKEFKKSKISSKSSFLIGICLSAVLLLRPNMIAPWICMAIYILIVYIKDKNYKELIKIILTFLSGIIVFMIPFIIYLSVNGALKDFFYQYIIFNFKYAKTHTASDYIETFIYFILRSKTFIFCLLIILYLFITKKEIIKKQKNFIWFNLILMIISFILVIQPSNRYAHYGFTMIPTYTYILTIFLEIVYKDWLKMINNNFKKILLIILFLSMLYISDISFLAIKINERINSNDSYKEVVEVVKKNSKQTDNVLVYGNNLNVLLKAERYTKFKYAYQIPIAIIDENVKKEFLKELKDEKPKLIVVSFWVLNYFEEDMSLINDYLMNYYECIYSEPSNFSVYKLVEKEN